MDGTWPVDSKIPTEAQLAESLGVGRSTVREAVRSLANLGILETAPGRGTFVRSANPVSNVLTDYIGTQSVADVLSIRRTLEIEAARKAAISISAEHLTKLRETYQDELEILESGNIEDAGSPPGDFHLALIAAGANQLLSELYTGLAKAVKQGIRDGRIISSPYEEKIRDHARILQAIEQHDVVEAVHAANDHGDRDLVLAEE